MDNVSRYTTLAFTAVLASGCASYVTPASGVSLTEFADENLRLWKGVVDLQTTTEGRDRLYHVRFDQ